MNLKKLAEGLVQATAEKERLTELLKIAAGEQARLSSEMEELRRAPPLPAPSCDESALREQIANLERHVHRQAEERVELLARLGATGRAATNNGERREPAGHLPVAARGPRDEVHSTE